MLDLSALAVSPSALQADPYRNLITAVVVQAICDLSAEDKGVRAAARSWMYFSELDDDWSFPWCCLAIGLAPDQVQRLCATPGGAARIRDRLIPQRGTNYVEQTRRQKAVNSASQLN